MGYDVWVTRCSDEDPFGVDPPITVMEFFNAVGSEPGFEVNLDGHAAHAAWGPPERVRSDVLAWRNGHVWAKNPTEPFLLVMYRVAQRLQARVIDEDGCVFDANGKGTVLPWAVPSAAPKDRPSKDATYQRDMTRTLLLLLAILVLPLIALALYAALTAS